MKTFPDSGFEVEYCSNLPIIRYADGSTDADVNHAEYTRLDFPTASAARKHAGKLLANGTLAKTLGCALIRQYTTEKRRGVPDRREYIGEPEEVS